MKNEKCVFCREDGFDLIGLKHHIENYCEGFDATPDFEQHRNILNEDVVQKASDEWVWFVDGIWKEMTVDEQISWTGRNLS